MTQQSRAEAAAEAAASTDAAVIQLSRHEPEHFTVLFRRHAPYIQRYVVRRLGPDAADDIVAETFLLAFRQRDRYDQSRTDARPWLYGIARRVCARRLETRAVHQRRLRLVEQAGPMGWDRYVGSDGATVTMSSFGASAPLKDLQGKFGFTVDNVVKVAREVMEKLA